MQYECKIWMSKYVWPCGLYMYINTYIWCKCNVGIKTVCIIFQRDSLLADPAYAACGPAGRNLASPGISSLHPSAGTQLKLLRAHPISTTKPWGLLIIISKLVAFCRGIYSCSSSCIIFFHYYACRESLVEGMHITEKKNIQQSQKKRAAVQ